jgi:hypothetical protein
MARQKKIVFAESDSDGTQNSSPVTRQIWNFNINDLVIYKHTKEVGLIISTSIYKNRRISANTFVVLLTNKIVTLKGSEIKLI